MTQEIPDLELPENVNEATVNAIFDKWKNEESRQEEIKQDVATLVETFKSRLTVFSEESPMGAKESGKSSDTLRKLLLTIDESLYLDHTARRELHDSVAAVKREYDFAYAKSNPDAALKSLHSLSIDPGLD